MLGYHSVSPSDGKEGPFNWTCGNFRLEPSSDDDQPDYQAGASTKRNHDWLRRGSHRNQRGK